MNIKSYLFIFAIILIAYTGYGQAKTDTTYIEKYDKKMSVMAFLSRSSIEIDQNDKSFQPNSPMKIGLGLAIKNTVLNISYGAAITQTSNKDHGKTKALDFQLHQYGRYFVLDLFYQKYKGFYNDDNGVSLYPNTTVQITGAEGTYIFKGNKLSAKAAFQQSEKQLKSVGSFVLGGGIYNFRIKEVNDLFPWENNNINNLQLGASAGYAYSWVINEHWLLSGIATVGANFGNETHLLEKGNVKIYPAVFTRGSFGYHKNDWAVNFSFLINNKSLYVDEEDSFNISSLNMQISFVQHLDNFFKAKK